MRARHLIFWAGMFQLLTYALFGQPIRGNGGEIYFPDQNQPGSQLNEAYQTSLTNSPTWNRFTQLHGGWKVIWNEASGTPHRAYGPSIQLPGYGRITRQNIEAAAGSFLKDNAQFLKINPDQLQLVRKTYSRRKWYVSYRQTYQGKPVLFSEVELRIFENGRVMAFGSDFYRDIQLSTSPSVSASDASRAAVSGLKFNPATDKVVVQNQLAVLPIRSGATVEYHLVYQANVETRQPVGNYITFVDAQTGRVLWRHNRVRYATFSGSVLAEIHPVQPTDSLVQKPLRDLKVIVDGVTVLTDSLGNFSSTGTTTGSLTASFSGRFVQVNRQDAGNSVFAATATAGTPLTILWDDTNSQPAERDAFYHTNFIHTFLKKLDPSFTGVDYAMPCAVNIGSTCNAFWDGTGINFFLAGGGCANTGEIASVIYHEYTHGINEKLYKQQGATLGMVNGAANEGTADVMAAFIEDNPQVGRGFFTAGNQTLRNVENTLRFPQDATGEIHHDGLFLAGSFWDLRKLTDLNTALNLYHFSKYGVPDDTQNGLAFSEWFIETLVADDDDGNLDNGTPHFTEINQAFNNHNIGSLLFLSLSFSHLPRPDTQDTTNPYNVVFSLNGAPISGSAPVDPLVHYSLDRFRTEQTVPASLDVNKQYRAKIPAQPAGSFVSYYISAVDPLAGDTLRFPTAAPDSGAYTFLVGFNTVQSDAFETDTGWKAGAPDDNATTGLWERADPQGTSINNITVQPEFDHTVSGKLCWVTGALAGAGAGTDDVDGGKTTLFSPVFDLSGMNNPVIRYYKWYSNDKGASPGQDYWQVDISADGGATWSNVENTKKSSSGWEKVQFPVKDFITPTNQVKLRFVASDLPPGSLVEALLDDFEILDADVVTAIGNGNTHSLPTEFALKQNYPNPFNPETRISYDLPKASFVVVEIYNTLGQKVRVLLSENQSAGSHTLRWDGRNSRGATLPSGIYLYRLTARPSSGATFVQTRKMLLIR